MSHPRPKATKFFQSDFRNKSTADAASTTLRIICFLIGVGGRQFKKRPGVLAGGMVEAMDLGSVTLPNRESSTCPLQDAAIIAAPQGPLDATGMVKTDAQ